MNKLDEILNVARRLHEPQDDGIYHVYDNWFKKEPKHYATIEVKHGPRGGYKRPVLFNVPKDNPRRQFYWRDGYIWLTPEEHKNVKSGCSSEKDNLKHLVIKIAELESQLDTYSKHITEKRFINAYPDDELPIRILEAHLDYGEFSDNFEGLEPTDFIVVEMNKNMKLRNEIIEKAIAELRCGRC